MSAFGDLVGNMLAAADSPAVFTAGTVKSFAANGSNPPIVTVRWHGTDVLAACPRHYTPVVGHVVLMARLGPQLSILGAY